MSRCDTMTIEDFEDSLTLHVDKFVDKRLIDTLYNSKICYFDSIEIALGNFFIQEDIIKLNRVLLYTANSSIAKHGVKDDITSYYFTKDFFDREKRFIEIRLTAFKEVFEEKKQRPNSQDSVCNKNKQSLRGFKRINTVKDIKNILE